MRDDEEDFEERIDVSLPLNPVTGQAPKNNSISREHVRVKWSDEDESWVMEVMGRNGAYLFDDFIKQGETVRIWDGARITLFALDFSFHLPSYDDDSGSQTEPDSDDGSEELSGEDVEPLTPERPRPGRFPG